MWFKFILPIIALGDTPNIDYKLEYKQMKHTLLHGWKIGIECDKDQKLNQSTYDVKDMCFRDRIEILQALTTDLTIGKIINWLISPNGFAPLFIRPKEIDPIALEIKNGTRSDKYPSLNALSS